MSWYSRIYTCVRDYRTKNPCSGWLLTQSLNILLILQFAMTGYLIFAYWWALCYHFLMYKIQAIVYISVHTILSTMAIWSLMATISTPATRVPPQYKTDDETDKRVKEFTPFDGKRYQPDKSSPDQVTQQKEVIDRFCRDRRIRCMEVDHCGRIRYCYQCNLIKPDRSHHCSSCGFCVVKFDHHCPWINQCVNYGNYKFFVLYIYYSVAMIVMTVLTSIEGIVRFFIRAQWMDDLIPMIMIVFSLVVMGTFAYYPLGEMLFYHRGLIARNETTCEQAKIPIIRGDNMADYNQGVEENIRQAMGWGLWFFPVSTQIIDGLHYEIRYTDARNPYRMKVKEVNSEK